MNRIQVRDPDQRGEEISALSPWLTAPRDKDWDIGVHPTKYAGKDNQFTV